MSATQYRRGDAAAGDGDAGAPPSRASGALTWVEDIRRTLRLPCPRSDQPGDRQAEAGHPAEQNPVPFRDRGVDGRGEHIAVDIRREVRPTNGAELGDD